MNRQQRRSKGRGEDDAVDDDVADERDLEEAALDDDGFDGDPDDDGAVATAIPARRSTVTAASSSTATGTRRATPRQFLHEVNVEMRKVVWPSRAETVNYASVVLVTLAVLMALIFVLDLAFTKVAGYLFT